MLSRIRTFLIGPPLPTLQLSEKRLNKVRALAAFSPDALSSITYANQKIYLGLVVAGSLGLSLTVGAFATGATLLIVAFSKFLQGAWITILVIPSMDHLDQQNMEHHDGQLAAVVLPEFIPARWWEGLLHNQTSLLICTALLYRRRIHDFQRVIIDVPYHLKR